MATIMGQQHQRIHHICREHQEDIGDNESPPGKQSGEIIVSNYIYEEMMSPSSLLRSDRFARSKPTVIVAGPGEETGRDSEQVRSRDKKVNNSARAGICGKISSPMSEAANTMHRRGRAAVSADSGSFNKVRKRGKAPSKVRPMTAAGTTSKVRNALGQVQSKGQNGEKYLQPCQATHSPQEMSGAGSVTNIPAIEYDSDAPPSSKIPSRGQICLFPSAGSEPSSRTARLSQSPLRTVSMPFVGVSEGYFQQSPIESKPVLARVCSDQMARRVLELRPSSQLDDEWSSRCFNLTQQIVEQLRSWNQTPTSDGQRSTSPTLSRPQFSPKSSTSRDCKGRGERQAGIARSSQCDFERSWMSSISTPHPSTG